MPVASVIADLEAILRAISSVAASSASSGTLWFISPISAARGAGIMSPVSSISIACLFDTFRDSATMGVEQKRPICTPGVLNRAVSAANARSQLATSWQPAAVATPVTRAMTGLGQATMACINAEHLPMIRAKISLPPSGAERAAVSSFRS